MNKSRRLFIKHCVIQALRNVDTLTLPVNIKHITKSYNNIRLISYSKYMKSHNLSLNEMIKFAGTEDAFTDYSTDRNKYIICYNDLNEKMMESNRYRWTIAHELGHVLLYHHIDSNESKLFRNTIASQKYKQLEDEADLFASYILVPHSPLFEFRITTATDIKKYCKISSEAAKYRIKDYKTWQQTKYSEQYDFDVEGLFYKHLLEQYKADPTYSRKRMTRRTECLNCKYTALTVNDLNKSYCPICGGKGSLKLTKEKIDKLKYVGIKLDEYMRPINCPECGNDEIDGNAFYCKICGEPILNSCTNSDCDKNNLVLPGNARYCPYCGSPTEYFNRNWLNNWNSSRTPPSFDGFPTYTDDEDSPF